MFAAPYPSATSWLETSHTILDTNSLRDDDDHEDDYDKDDHDDQDHDIYKKKNIFNPKILFWSDISECLIYCRSALIPMQMDLLEPILEKVVFGLTLFSMTMGKLW